MVGREKQALLRRASAHQRVGWRKRAYCGARGPRDSGPLLVAAMMACMGVIPASTSSYVAHARVSVPCVLERMTDKAQSAVAYLELLCVLSPWNGRPLSVAKDVGATSNAYTLA